MEDKEAINILMRMMDKYSLDLEEKEAILTAIGILSWSKLGKGRMESIIKAHKAKRAKALGNKYDTTLSFH